MRHQYGISELVSQTSFGGETSGIIAKCQLFSQASILVAIVVVEWLQYYRELKKSIKCVNSLPGQVLKGGLGSGLTDKYYIRSKM